MPLVQDLNEKLTEEEPASSQVSDQMGMMIHMLVDMYSRIQATEDGIREMRDKTEKVTTCMLGLAASRVDGSRAWNHHQQSPQVSDSGEEAMLSADHQGFYH